MNTAIADRLTAALLLAVALAGIAWFAFPRDRPSRSHARWLRRATIGFVVPTMVALAVLGRLDALLVRPGEFAVFDGVLPRVPVGDLAGPVAIGFAIGNALIGARIGIARWRGWTLPRRLVFPAPLAAAGPGEIGPAIVVALWAGVSEELAFRLGLPLLLTLVTGQALLGFGIATVVFVGLHRYQPWSGRLLVGVAGATLAFLYLVTGALWFAVLVHAAMDVMGLAVRPWLAGFSAGRARP